VRDWPTVNVAGRAAGPTEYPVPVIESEFTVSAEVPEEVIVKARVLDEPSLTFPKPREVALSAICGVEEVPVPVKGTVHVAPVVQLVANVRLPLTVPAVFGPNVTGIASDWPGERLSGSATVPIEKPLPESDRELSDAALFPDEVAVRVIVLDEPSATLP
jgi:hypothetical protein